MRRGPNRETTLARGIVDAVRLLGVPAFRVQCGKIQTKRGTWMQLAPQGVPDVWSALCFLEIKVPDRCKDGCEGKCLNDNQKRWHADARSWGVKVYTVHSVGEAVSVVRRELKAWQHGKAMGWL